MKTINVTWNIKLMYATDTYLVNAANIYHQIITRWRCQLSTFCLSSEECTLIFFFLNFCQLITFHTCIKRFNKRLLSLETYIHRKCQKHLNSMLHIYTLQCKPIWKSSFVYKLYTINQFVFEQLTNGICFHQYNHVSLLSLF